VAAVKTKHKIKKIKKRFAVSNMRNGINRGKRQNSSERARERKSDEFSSDPTKSKILSRPVR
jgi:hypothetical protein